MGEDKEGRGGKVRRWGKKVGVGGVRLRNKVGDKVRVKGGVGVKGDWEGVGEEGENGRRIGRG